MLDKAQRRMTPEEFYAWQEAMDEKYELVDGYPVRRGREIELMAGASKRHDRIVWNLIRALGNQLAERSCHGFTSDTAVRTLKQTRRRPDVGIECGDRDDRSVEATDVRFVAEVLSPSTHELDVFVKLDEYRAIQTMRYVLVVEPNEPLAMLWRRQGDGSWIQETAEGRDARINLDELGISLSLDEIYAGLTFRALPRLIGEQSDQ